jgi:hypothetical protein
LEALAANATRTVARITAALAIMGSTASEAIRRLRFEIVGLAEK